MANPNNDFFSATETSPGAGRSARSTKILVTNTTPYVVNTLAARKYGVKHTGLNGTTNDPALDFIKMTTDGSVPSILAFGEETADTRTLSAGDVTYPIAGTKQLQFLAFTGAVLVEVFEVERSVMESAGVY